jgi:hypothetical protein
MIVASVCTLALLCAQVPLDAQMDEVVPKEQAIARIQKHLDMVNASMKASETRHNVDNCTKALRDAIAKLGVSTQVSDGRNTYYMDHLLILCSPLSQVETFYRQQQYQLEVALATIRFDESTPLTRDYRELLQETGGAVKKTYMDYVDGGMAEFKKRDQEVADNINRWIEAVALKAREAEQDVANGDAYWGKIVDPMSNRLHFTVLLPLQAPTFFWLPFLAFAKLAVAPKPGGATPAKSTSAYGAADNALP